MPVGASFTVGEQTHVSFTVLHLVDSLLKCAELI